MPLSMKNTAKLLHAVTSYWDNRATSYSEANQEELATQQKSALWQTLLLAHAPEKKTLKVLDIGTGPGFFAIIMAQAGHNVTAVDATKGMLDQARHNASHYDVDIEFVESDVHHLAFEDGTFDLIVTRNVTWNLKEPESAYREWFRVLKKDCCLVNFDANWYLHLFDEDFKRGFEEDRANTQRLNIPDHYVNTDTVAMAKIAEVLPLSRIHRPQWDMKTLLDIGFSECLVDTAIGNTVWDEEEKINYASTPMFMIVAKK